MPCIKVGINEWVVINKAGHNDFTLWTDGLSGCVGVAIATNDRAFMTHIDSKVSVEDWTQKIEKDFLEAVSNLGNYADIQICEIVIGDDDITKLAYAVFQSLMKVLKEAKFDDWTEPSVRCDSTGMRIYLNAGTFKLEERKRMGSLPAWGTDQNSAEGAAHIEHQGFFPGGQRADRKSEG